MRQSFLLLCLCGLLSNIYAQKSLFLKIKGENGLSRQFTKLDPAEQVVFNPADARGTLGINANSNLVLIRKEADKLGQTHYRYFQSYNEIPVENSMLVAHTTGGKLTGISGSIVTEFNPKKDLNATATVSPAQAINAALNYVHAEKYAWEDADFEQRIKFRNGKTATYYPVPSKVWYGGDDEIDPSSLELCYKIDVYTLQPLDRKFVYVDAKTGRVTGTKQEMMHSDATGTAATGYSGTQTIHSDLNGSSYRLRDYTKGNGIITLHAASGHADYTNSSANWALTGVDKWALDAHFGVAATWTYYKNNFNRNSVDNAGYALTSWVNDAATTDNAYWDGSEMDYGNLSSNGNGLTAIDITGHELTHGVTQYTCNLTYSKEPGAMNESMSDIMGKSVQFYTKPTDNSWILSNDMGWEIRSFSNPNADGQPDTYKGKYWTTSSADNYGVHTNSGVGNFMFYLLVTGGSGTNDIGSAYTVSGIGLSKADQILYRTQTVYLTSTSNYAAWRTACINAATDLYGAGSNEVIQVQNAWYAVGIGAAGGSSCTLTAPTGLAAGSLTNTSAVISWNAVSGAAGYTIQYKLSSASGFTTVTGITGTSYNLTGLTAGSSYQVQAATVCSGGGNGAYSSPVTFTTTGTTPVTYCASKGTTTYEYLKTVVLGTINHTVANDGGYGNYTTLSTNLAAGTAYTIKLTPGFPSSSYTEYYTVYIDYNHDGILNGTGETVATGSGSGTAAKSLTFTVPATAKNGSTRIRIQMRYGSASTNPCATLTYGDVHDYTVSITGGSGFAASALVANKPVNDVKAISVYPNPVAGTTATVRYQLAKDGPVILRIADIYGRTVKSENLGKQNQGSYIYRINSIKELAKGNYFIVIYQNNEVTGRNKVVVIDK